MDLQWRLSRVRHLQCRQRFGQQCHYTATLQDDHWREFSVLGKFCDMLKYESNHLRQYKRCSRYFGSLCGVESNTADHGSSRAPQGELVYLMQSLLLHLHAGCRNRSPLCATGMWSGGCEILLHTVLQLHSRRLSPPQMSDLRSRSCSEAVPDPRSRG